MGSKFTELIVDCADPSRLAAFWAAALGWQPTGSYDEGVEIAGPPGSGASLVFIRVPEAKTVKNRLHLDLRPDDQDAEVERVIARGATRADVGQDGSESWVVLADPEGNEFCILRRLTEEEQAS